MKYGELLVLAEYSSNIGEIFGEKIETNTLIVFGDILKIKGTTHGLCRSRQALSNESSIAKNGVRPSENGPLGVWERKWVSL